MSWSETKPLAQFTSYKDPKLDRGLVLFYKKGCQYCHEINGHGSVQGPNLSKLGRTWNAAQPEVQIVNGGGNISAYGGQLNKAELNNLGRFLQVQK